MLLPRYLLREDVVMRLIGRGGGSRIADIGCGGGEILIILSRLGYSGIGYDPSPVARACARQRLIEAGQRGFEIVDRWPDGQRFDVVLLLEVLGYSDVPLQLLRECRDLLLPGGSLLISFVRPGAGYDPRVIQGMSCFSVPEVRLLLHEAGFREVEIENYGYPLANATVRIMNLVQGLRVRHIERRGERVETGLFHRSKWLAPLGLISNRWILKPFMVLQRKFAGTELGNGFVARARIGQMD
jgi:SAM-dependent methyltransferase